MISKTLVCGGAVILSVSAHAGTKPLYQPTPPWVVAAPTTDLGTITAPPLLIFDQQQRLANGQVWNYVDRATRVTSQQSLLEAGTIILGWQPDEGDLIVHRIAILRDGKEIDLLADKDPLTIIRRERGLEALELDGVLTATMPVKGLQVGDILRVTVSTTRSDPALKGRVQSVATLLPDQTEVGFARIRALWPVNTNVHWKALAKVTGSKVVRVGDEHELTVTTPLPKQPDMPGDAPARFNPLPLVELSTFADWADVSRTMAPLFIASPFVPGSPLAVEVARIAAATTDPLTRTALALQSVQGNVRYLFNGLDHGNYVPQPPEKTWAIRSGDCKAKTLLLLSMLTALGIAAEPVLANTHLGDFLPSRLPSAGAFNHILVAATVDKHLYWLDGTGLGARLADLGNAPNLRFVLPLRAGGAGLSPVATHANAEPDLALEIESDQSAGIGLLAPSRLSVTFRGPTVEALKAADRQLSGDKRKEMIDKLIANGGLRMIVVNRKIAYDPAAGTATVTVSGLANAQWAREDQHYESRMDGVVGALKFDGDRGRPEWRAIPVATAGVQSRILRVRLRLPSGGTGFTVEGDRTLPPMLAGFAVARTTAVADGVFTITDRVDETAAEIAPDKIADTRAALALAKSRTLKVSAPRDYPHHWQVVRDARAAGKIAPIEKAFASAIADATEKEPLLLERAAFRQSVFDRAGALADFDTVAAARPTASVLRMRAFVQHQMRHDERALADAKAAYDLDPGSTELIIFYSMMLSEAGKAPQGLALLDDAIAAGGERKATLLSGKAHLLARRQEAESALAAIDAAIAAKAGDAGLLNSRCWIKATLGVQLPTALKDCTKALELGNDSAATLDSRALVFFKLGRLDDALTDVDAALLDRPDQAGSLYLRGAIEARLGAKAKSEDDLTGARTDSPRIDEEYACYGVRPS